MAPKLDPYYDKMVNTSASPVRPHKNANRSPQRLVDSCIKETTRLRYAQNSRAAVSRLPTELLADVFLRIVESGLRDGDTRFVTGTFCFLQVCRRWNEVAVSFPLLWGWWVAGAVRAWPLFNSRSRDVPLFLMWRPQLPDSARDVLMDPTITSKRIRQLDFSGTNEQLVQLLDAFDSNPPSNASSIRIQIFPFDRRYHRKSDDPRGHIARFLSPPFPRLARLDLENILPNSSSPIFTTSNLISLKLSILYARENRYTPSQLLQILRQHPNLQELDLNHDAIPLPGPPSAPVSFVLPRLADLRLYGSEAAILGFIDLICMSSPLHNVIVCFELNRGLTIPGLASTVKEMLVAYYECQGLNYSRTVDHLIISYDSGERYLAFNTRSHSVPTSNLGLKANLRLQFNGVLPDDAMATEIFPLFPLHDLQEFTAEGQVIYGCRYRGMFQKMKNLSHLRLENLDIRPVLGALSSGSQDAPFGGTILAKLESLTVSHLDILSGRGEQLLDVLKGRRDRGVGLKKLVIRSCRVHEDEYRSRLGQLVEEVEWDGVIAVGSSYRGTENGPDTDELEDNLW